MDAETKRIRKKLMDELAVLNIRLSYAKNRREIEKQQIRERMQEIEKALAFIDPTLTYIK